MFLEIVHMLQALTSNSCVWLISMREFHRKRSELIISPHHLSIISPYCNSDTVLTDELRSNLTRLIAYAKSADTTLQRQVAEKLANEAVKRENTKPYHLPLREKEDTGSTG